MISYKISINMALDKMGKEMSEFAILINRTGNDKAPPTGY